MSNTIDTDYKCIISIGMRCFTEIFLKSMNLKKFSCVFDGMYNTNIHDIINILENRFTYDELIYTDIISDNYIKELNVKHGNRTIHKNINYKKDDLIYSYHNAFLPHHNLNNIHTRNHFDRCFNRIDKIKHDKIRTLFCLFIHPAYGTDTDISFDDINILTDYLIKHFNCRLLVCKFKQNKNTYNWKCVFQDDNLIYIHINNNSHLFNDNKDVLDEIIKYVNVYECKLLTYDEL
jgi:hypothetical protein